MNTAELETLDALREWDWEADLKREERTIPWLARKTGKSQRSVYSYRYGQARPPLEWLAAAFRVLNGRQW